MDYITMFFMHKLTYIFISSRTLMSAGLPIACTGPCFRGKRTINLPIKGKEKNIGKPSNFAMRYFLCCS